MNRLRLVFGLFPAAVLVTRTVLCFAQVEATTGGADARARADELFDAALRDAEAGNYAAACPKFRASFDADPKASTMLNLALCFEKKGQTASAWGAFREAERLSLRTSHPDWAKSARERAQALEGRLSRLTLVPPSPLPEGFTLRRDGVFVTEGEYQVGIPVDPGPHDIQATAPGRSPWKAKIDLREGERFTLPIPTLAEASAGTDSKVQDPGPSTVPPQRFHWTPLRIAGISVGGVGLLALGVGSILGLQAQGTYRDATRLCNQRTTDCSAGAVAKSEDAFSQASQATLWGISGAALTASGLVLWILGSSHAPSTTTGASAKVVGTPSLRVHPSLQSITLTGTF